MGGTRTKELYLLSSQRVTRRQRLRQPAAPQPGLDLHFTRSDTSDAIRFRSMGQKPTTLDSWVSKRPDTSTAVKSSRLGAAPPATTSRRSTSVVDVKTRASAAAESGETQETSIRISN